MKNNDKKNASLILASYFDTLGFNNGNWEFNFNTELPSLKDGSVMNQEIYYNYLYLGGANIDISEWNASDDTILMIATMKACDKGGKKNDYREEYLKVLPLLKDEEKRGSGFTTLRSLDLVKQNQKIYYDKSMGGNGPASRTSYIGIKHHDNIDEIIKQSIRASRITHNHPIGFLGGLVTALFTSYAYNNIDPFEWSKKLLELYNSNKIDDYMKDKSIYEKYKLDSEVFWDLWYQFNDDRLNGYKYKTKKYLFNINRLLDLEKYMLAVKSKTNYGNFGGSGVGAVIYAYDCILTSYNFDTKKYNFELLKTISTLHFGDNDTTGAIAGCWFGALTGFEYFDKNIINMLEFKDELL